MVRLTGCEDRTAKRADLGMQVVKVRDASGVRAFRLPQNTGGTGHLVGGCGHRARGVVVLLGEFAQLLV